MGARPANGAGVVSVALPPGPATVLPGADFMDCYRVAVPFALTAPEAVDRIFSQSPEWVGRLIALRDRMVSVFGLKPAGDGPFPILSSELGEVVLGLDDTHLDFRLLVGVSGDEVTLTTYVRTNNLLGRVYLMVILPFHRLVARAMLGKLAQARP